MINFISLKQRTILYGGRKDRQERAGIKVTIVTEENPAEFIKVKVNGT